MPRSRQGGARQGTPGKGYMNRTDLMTQYAPDTQGTAASGGMPQPMVRPPAIGADEVPNIGDPTMRPDEPVTAGLSLGPGAGPEALGPMPPPPDDPVRMAVEAMMLIAPNPDLARVLRQLEFEGR